jgi:hypothetical protein
MGFIGSVLKKVVSGLSKVADIVAPICAFIPGLNPVVTLVAAGIKAVDGLTDKPPNLGKIFDGVMGLIPGGALGKVLGPFAKLGGGTAGKFAEMFTGAIAGKGPGAGGLLGDLLQTVVGNARIGGAGSPLGSLASTLLGSLSDKIRSPLFTNSVSSLVQTLAKAGPNDILSADQIAAALTQPTGNMVERLIDGVAQKVPEYVVHPELIKLLQGAVNQTISEAMRDSSVFQGMQQSPVSLSPAASQPIVSNPNAALTNEVMEQIRRNQGKS